MHERRVVVISAALATCHEREMVGELSFVPLGRKSLACRYHARTVV